MSYFNTYWIKAQNVLPYSQPKLDFFLPNFFMDK